MRLGLHYQGKFLSCTEESAPALPAGSGLILDQGCRDLAPFSHLDGQEEGGGSSDAETGWVLLSSTSNLPLMSYCFYSPGKELIRWSMTSGFFGISVQESCGLLTGAQWKKMFLCIRKNNSHEVNRLTVLHCFLSCSVVLSLRSLSAPSVAG